MLDYLRVEADESLDRLVKRARYRVGVDMVSIRAVEADHQRYVATAGFDAEMLPRSEAVCAYTIMDDDDVLVVPYLQDDPRVAA